MKVLVVDDQYYFCRALAARLEIEGEQVYTASTGQEAIALLQERTFDLVLLDHNLPDTTGLAVAGRVRDLHGAALIVLMSGLASGVGDPALLDPNVDAILPKPWKLPEWQAVMSRARQVAQACRSGTE